MSNIFEFSRIKSLVEKQKPSAILVVDTNVIIKQPHFENWKTSISEPLFIITDVILLELEHISKQKQDPKALEPFIQAKRCISELYKLGAITNGIHIKDVGWFISVASPKDSDIKPEIEQMDSICKAFGPSDTKLLILSRELSTTIANIPALVLTGDINLFNICSHNGIPAYQFSGFPTIDLADSISRCRQDLINIDWPKVIEGAITEIDSIKSLVSLTLTSKHTVPEWADSLFCSRDDYIIAEGYGTVGEEPFQWSCALLKYDIARVQRMSEGRGSCSSLSDVLEEDDIPETDSEESPMGGFIYVGQNIGESIRDQVFEKLAQCNSPSANLDLLPTFQDPIAVMENYFYDLYRQSQGLEINDDSFSDYKAEVLGAQDSGLENFFASILHDKNGIYVNETVMTKFLSAINNCWKIGQTITFYILKETC